MRTGTRFGQATQIAERFDWSRFSEVLDVGGGDGMVLAALLQAHPDLRGRVLDLSPTATAATRRFAAAGLDGRAGVVAGSFFDPLPAGADAYLQSDIEGVAESAARAFGDHGQMVAS